jgi:hypothetical protein
MFWKCATKFVRLLKMGSALVVAEHLEEILPENQWEYFYTAYVLRGLKRTPEAYDVLKAVIRKFPEHQMMYFNLACYSCQLCEGIKTAPLGIRLPSKLAGPEMMSSSFLD